MTAVVTASIDDRATLAAILAEAFAADPVMTWVFDDAVREGRLAAMWKFLAEAYLPAGDSTLLDVEHPAAAALWARADRLPGEEFWERRGAAFAEALEGDMERLDALSEAMRAHHPGAPHYYLLAIGVRSANQGQGLGTTLAAPTLARADAEGIGCYLEATSARSRDLYLRWGFEITSEFSAPGGPPLWAMWRPAVGSTASSQ